MHTAQWDGSADEKDGGSKVGAVTVQVQVKVAVKVQVKVKVKVQVKVQETVNVQVTVQVKDWVSGRMNHMARLTVLSRTHSWQIDSSVYRPGSRAIQRCRTRSLNADELYLICFSLAGAAADVYSG